MKFELQINLRQNYNDDNVYTIHMHVYIYMDIWSLNGIIKSVNYFIKCEI